MTTALSLSRPFAKMVMVSRSDDRTKRGDIDVDGDAALLFDAIMAAVIWLFASQYLMAAIVAHKAAVAVGRFCRSWWLAFFGPGWVRDLKVIWWAVTGRE